MAEHTVVIDSNLIRGSTGSHFRQQPYHFCKVIRILATAASPHTQRRAILSQSGAVILYPSSEQKTIIFAHGPPRHHRREIQCLSSVVKIGRKYDQKKTTVRFLNTARQSGHNFSTC